MVRTEDLVGSAERTYDLEMDETISKARAPLDALPTTVRLTARPFSSFATASVAYKIYLLPAACSLVLPSNRISEA